MKVNVEFSMSNDFFFGFVFFLSRAIFVATEKKVNGIKIERKKNKEKGRKHIQLNHLR